LLRLLNYKKLIRICRLLIAVQASSISAAHAEDMQVLTERITQDSFREILTQTKNAQTLLKNLTPKTLKKGNACKTSSTLLETEPPSNPSTLLLCVTLSMSGAALKAYARDIRKIGGRLVIRGLIDDSFLKTSKRLKALGIEVDIDPTVFDAFKVERVPTFIHVQGRPGAYEHVHDRLEGHVSVLYALEEFERSGDLDAVTLLNRVRGAS
jgi:type-F conjugative transfer system pilin assembly protein TrbC